jgi:dihydroorotate dehydrogenase electron transfer subunit
VRDPATSDPYLRRVAWLYAVDSARVSFVMSTRDAVMARLGGMLDLLAPLGRAIHFDANTRRIVFIGEGARIVQLFALAQDAAAQGRQVVLVHRAEQIFPAHWLSPEIEYRTDADALDAELIAWADALVASGSDESYRALADAIRAARYRLEPGFARAFVDAAMPCGAGVCYACAIETARGVRLACADGPAFDLTVLENRRVR